MLLDYGQVLSTAPPEDEWADLRRAAGFAGGSAGAGTAGSAGAGDEAEHFYSAYWEHRAAYDRADLNVGDYWTRVLGRAPSAAELAELIRLDVAVWLHPHQPSVDAAQRAASRGWRLALFSNAPVEVAAGIDQLDWLEPVERRFYSCRLRRIKPEPEAYLEVIQGLGAEPQDIVFFDDRAVNVEAARRLGIQAHVFSDAGQIAQVGDAYA